MNYKLSIITINRNNAEGLRKTIESVVSQTFTDYEYIVIDGASTDGSAEVIKQYEAKIIYWISESDTGIYNAMNKGILKASGEYCLFLNSGDRFKDIDSLFNYKNYLIDNFDIIYGNISVIGEEEEYIKTYPDKLIFSYFLNDTLPHPATLIKKDLFLKFGSYDENLQICSDWKFFVNAICLNSCTYKHIDFTISQFYLNGFSSDANNFELIKQEKQVVIENYFSAFWDDYLRLQYLEKFRLKILNSKFLRLFKRIKLLTRIKYE